MTNPTPVDELFDLAPEAPATGPDTAVTEPAPASEDAAPTTKLIYNNVVETYTEDQFGTRADGENPDYMTPAQFASHLSIRNFQAGRQTLADMVKDGNVHAAIKAVRAPLPVVLVFPNGTEESAFGTEAAQRDAKAYIPVAAATTAWDERPARGEGTGATKVRSEEDLLSDAAAKRDEKLKAEARLARATTAVEKLTSQYDKYTKWLADRDLSWDKVDAFVFEREANKEVADAPAETPAA